MLLKKMIKRQGKKSFFCLLCILCLLIVIGILVSVLFDFFTTQRIDWIGIFISIVGTINFFIFHSLWRNENDFTYKN